MKKLLVAGVFSSILFLAAGKCSYAETTFIAGLIDNFHKATDLQREQILKDNLGKEVAASGKVSNVGEYDFYDMASDIKGTYYQAVTVPQRTEANVVYQLIFLFKDKDKAKDINKGQEIRKDCKIIRILDERLQITVWLFYGEMDEGDNALMKQAG